MGVGERKKAMLHKHIFLTLFFTLLFGGFSGLVVSVWAQRYLDGYEALLFSQGPIRLGQERPRTISKTETEALEELRENFDRALVQIVPASREERTLTKEAFLSGVILTSDGWIMTHRDEAALAVPEAAKIVYNRRFYDIEQIVRDPGTPALFLKIDAQNLPVMPFWQGAEPLVGDRLFVAEDPHTLFFTTFISTVHDPEETIIDAIPRKRWRLAQVFSDVLLGSIVMNVNGELVGMVTQESEEKDARVLPLDVVLPAIEQLLENGVITRPSLGMSLRDFSGIVFGGDQTIPIERGVEILSLDAEGPAALAGMKVGDRVFSLNSVPLQENSRFDDLLLSYKPGDVLRLGIDRQGKEMEMEVMLAP